MSSQERLVGFLAVLLLAAGTWTALATTSHLGTSNPRGEAQESLADPSCLPKKLRSLSPELQGGKTPKQVYALIAKAFGRPTRDIGSGLSIPQWQLPEGVLTYHPLTGPTYCPESGGVVWLIRTHNPLAENLRGGYEMATCPDRYGTTYWLGTLHLNADGTFRFMKSDQNVEHSGKQRHFFALHPSGKYRVTYQPGLAPKTLLESLRKKTIVAALVFESSGAKKGYAIVSDPVERTLSSAGGADTEFRMSKGWKNYWR